MGANMQTLRTRMKSIDSTLHLTKAMGLVASSKIRKATLSMEDARQYETHLSEIVKIISNMPQYRNYPYIKKDGKRICLIAIAADRGLAGGYNANIFRALKSYHPTQIIPLGYRACNFFGKNAVSSEHFSPQQAYELAEQLCSDFLQNKFDKLTIVSTQYISMMTQKVCTRQILPFCLQTHTAKSALPLLEPAADTILHQTATAYTAGVIYACIKESYACETAARRLAMNQAEKNATETEEILTLQYNQARQGAITQEITEISAGSML